MTALLEARSLTKSFAHVEAVRDVSFAVEAGEVLGILGPNGAGKSTTMKMLTGFLRPTAGTALISAIDIEKDPIAAKTLLGYLPEGAPAYGEMTPRGFLAFAADVRGVNREMADRAVAAVALESVLDQPIETLSKGFRRRVGLAQAILHDPPVLVLDEPTDGLDPNQKHEVRGLISEMAATKAIAISTHLLEEVEALCSRVIVIDHGRIVASGTPDALRRRSRYFNAVRVRFTHAAGAAREIAGLTEVEAVEPRGDGVLIVVPKNGALIVDRLSALAREMEWGIEEISVERGRLDEVFRTITTGDREAAA